MNDIKSTFVRKRGNNYNVIVEYYNEDGIVKQKSIGKYENKKDAEAKLIELKDQIYKNKFRITKDITVADRFQLYIDNKKVDWSPNTTKNYEVCKCKNVTPFFKNTKLCDLNVFQLQQYINYLYRKYGYSGTKLRYSFIAAMLKETYRLREIQENLCDFVKIPSSKENKVGDTYTKEEVKCILEKVDNELELPITIMLLTGLRRGEVMGLRWKDIDFNNNTLTVNQTAIYVNSKLEYKKPKTQSSIRTLYLQNELMDLLKREKARQNELTLMRCLDNKNNLVCLNRYNGPWIPQTLAHCYKVFCNENNIRPLRLHDLRHTNATLLVLSGTDFKTISNRLGHTDIKITINRYAHALEELDKSAAQNLSNLIF